MVPGACIRAQSAPEIVLETLTTGLAQPTAIAHAGDARVFLTLQRGQVVVFDGGRILSSSFLDIQSLVGCCGERGLLGMALAPDWLQFLAEWNPISALVQALRELWGNEGLPLPPDAALPLQYPVIATLLRWRGRPC